jgi:hypothetical protein
MNNRKHSILKSIGLASAAGVLTLGGLSGCSQQGVSCATAHGPFAVKFTQKTDTGGVCAGIPGGVYGLATYNAVGAEGRPDLDKASMAIQAEDLGLAFGDAEVRLFDERDKLLEALETTPDDPELQAALEDVEARLESLSDGEMYAKGDFITSEPNVLGVCEVPELAPADKTLPVLSVIPEVPEVVDDPATTDVDESVPAEPAIPAVPETLYKYEWSDLKFLVSEANQGTRFVGTVRITINTGALPDDPTTPDVDESVAAEDCVAEYEAVGLFPAVFCGAEDADGNLVPDDRLCSAAPVAEAGMVVGSGISPDFETVCDPDIFYCVLKDKPVVE